MTTEALPTTLLISATVASGLAAGLLYGFACAVMPGLKEVDDRAFVSTMQSVNRRILNGWFLLTFVGSPVLTIGAGVAAFVADTGDHRFAIGGAAVLSLLSVAITGSINVPLNNALDAAGDPAPGTSVAAVRARFERRWTRGNIARAAASTAAFGGLVWALAGSG